ncbi:DnaJ protein [Plasmodium brasilianum]|uniref:DnaJ protein, putative n=2 Tax=Plasmodium (Plasmodium) TaxID=418103 RepID=A0A1D3SPA1_PLAMA|nr:DnaJ protein, putative [Plasmodium malariae]KAI4836468.1 DnaJ protein [Plasmodium brasilianum]SCO93746.1 DnaJ protein, putative [Plasmodium malariae]
MFLIKKRYICFYNSICKSNILSKTFHNGKSTGMSQRSHFSSKSFYDILNVKKGSSKNEIKQAYRKLALMYHPDRNPNNRKESEQKFREITEAYETLSDDNKKKIYDSQLNNGFYSDNFNSNYSTSSNNNVNYNFQTRKMTDEEIENVFKNVFGTMNLNDIFKSNIFNESNIRTRTMGSSIFSNFGSAGSYENSSNNIKQTNIKTEIIPRGNKIIEKTTKIITYKDGHVQQEIIEREINNNSKDFEDFFDVDFFLKNNIHNMNNDLHMKKFNRNLKDYKQNNITKQILNYVHGILSIATRRILVNFVVHVMRKAIQTILYMLRKK